MITILFYRVLIQDGKRSAQFEQTLLVTDTGCDILTKRLDADGAPYFETQSSTVTKNSV
jgi:methionyl aminopeptidase